MAPGWIKLKSSPCLLRSSRLFLLLVEASQLRLVSVITATYRTEEHHTPAPTEVSNTKTNSQRQMSLQSHQFYLFFTPAVLKQSADLHNKSSQEHAYTREPVPYIYTQTPDVLETASFPENNLPLSLKELIQHINCPPQHTHLC